MLTRNTFRGFTLIELVIVIVLLGILSAVALPRFMDLSTDARRSVNQGTVGALASAMSMLSAKSMLPTNAGVNSATAPTLKAVDPDPNNPSGAYYVFFPVSTSTTINQRYPIGATPTKYGTSGLPHPTMTTSDTNWGAVMNATTGYQQACTNIFNALLSDNSVQAASYTGNNLNSAAYQTAAAGTTAVSLTSAGALTAVNGISGSIPATPTAAPINGAAASWSAIVPSTTAAGSCLWVNTGSIGNSPVFMIFYDQSTGKMVALEG